MPQNKRESLIFTVMMCFFMVLWMSVYNTSMNMGGLSLESIKEGWLGFPMAYLIAMCLDLFLVSGLAKAFAFRFLVRPDSSNIKKTIAISSCMVVPMVIIMSMYGAFEVSMKYTGFSSFGYLWLTNIPKNFIMALPLQLLIAGPITRTAFRKLFPVGTIIA